MAQCMECRFWRRGHRSGPEHQYQWTAETIPGVPSVMGRCQLHPPEPPTAEYLTGWRPCHEADWCSHWEAIAT